MPLDPEARTYLDELAAVGAPPIWEAGIDETRREMDSAAPALVPFEEVESVEDTTAGTVPVDPHRHRASRRVLDRLDLFEGNQSRRRRVHLPPCLVDAGFPDRRRADGGELVEVCAGFGVERHRPRNLPFALAPQ